MKRIAIIATALLLASAGCGEKELLRGGLPAGASAQAGEHSIKKTQPTGPAEEDKSRHDPWQVFVRRRAELKVPEGLTLTLATDKKEYYAGEPILVTTTYKMKGPGNVQIWAGTYDRSGRINDIWWLVVAPDGKPAPDPLASYWIISIGGGGGNYATVSGGKPFSQGFYVNEWARFDREGEYEIAVVSSRVKGDWSVASDRVKINVRKPTEAEINFSIARYTQAMDTKKPRRDYKGSFSYRKAALFLRFLHDERALPHYIKYLNIQEFSFQAACAIYGLPDHKEAFAALSAKIADKEYPISSNVASTYQKLILSLNPLPVSATDLWPVGPSKEQHDKITAQLRSFAAKKSPRARAISVFALTPANEEDPEYAIELAKSLKDMPERSLVSAVRRVGLKKMPEVVPYLESFLNHKIKAVRSAALGSLIKQGRDEYLEDYLDDYVSERPRYGGHVNLNDLSEARQLKLAALLDHDDRKVAERAARSLKKFATTQKIVPFIRKGLKKWTYPYGPRSHLFEAWVKVDPEGAKRPLINYMRSDPRSNRPHDIVGALKHYLDDPQVVQLILEIARGERARWHARQVLIEARLPEVVPVLLEEARAETSALSWNGWRYDLEKFTGHIIPLTRDHDSLAKQAAVLDEWERWWHQYKDKPLIERARSNIEHAIGLLETDELAGRARRTLREVTGKKFAEDVYLELTYGWPIKVQTVNNKKLKGLWAKWWAANRATFRPVGRD